MEETTDPALGVSPRAETFGGLVGIEVWVGDTKRVIVGDAVGVKLGKGTSVETIVGLVVTVAITTSVGLEVGDARTAESDAIA